MRGLTHYTKMKKLQLKKLTLSEMPTEELTEVNGGFPTTISLVSLYTIAVTASACDDCASYGCPTKAHQSAGSCCLCSGYSSCYDQVRKLDDKM